ncbi:60S ribosomal protein L7 [Pseudoloma neurophilia]|uniref:60S ribosomal protein L7 n=1 Tax=Pseudoloma neurophilia TaxID=146866 RepID=A0A0R0M1P2_9MICR|nr:60S ribosomal protein L7 [Pseudoloma neurophilia]
MSDILNIPPESFERMQKYLNKLVNLKKEQENQQNELIISLEQKSKARKLEIQNTLRKLEMDNQTKLEESKVTNSYFIKSESNFLIVILVRSKCRVSAKLNKVFDLFRLENIHTAVLIKNNESNRNMLKIIKDYVAYGNISYNFLRELIKKRGKGRVFDKHTHQFNTKLFSNHSKVENLGKNCNNSENCNSEGKILVNKHNLFKSEKIVDKEAKLRKKAGHTQINLTPINIYNTFQDESVICLDDLCLNIYLSTDKFKIINNFLEPFKLNCPKGGFKKLIKGKNYADGGILGNWHGDIENLIERMIE